MDNKEVFECLRTLKEIGNRIGMWGKLRRDSIEEDPIATAYCYTVFVQTDNLMVKQCMGMMMDYYKPNWREYVPREQYEGVDLIK